MKLAPLVPALALVAACGRRSHPPQSFAGLVRVSGLSPFPAGCAPPGQEGTNFVNAEVEPYLAVDPTDPRHLVGVWQQDRWSNGGSNGLVSAVSFDGGNTWSTSFAHFTRCSGGTAALGTDFDRASDPWVTFAPDGTPHQIGFSFNAFDARAAMLAVRSLDGGRTWTEPAVLYQETDPGYAIDKESITADPSDANLVYAVWDRLSGINTTSAGTGPAWFTRTTDGGAHWVPAYPIYDPGVDAQTIGNQIVVLPDGTLLDLLTVITQMSLPSAVAQVAVLRSTDKGVSWPQLVPIAVEQSIGVIDPKSRHPVRTGDIVPSIAVDRHSGAVYAAWEDARFTSGAREGIAISKSVDGGQSWSQPTRVNGETGTQAFTPVVAVAQDGKVGVTYTDLRNDDPSDDSRLLATVWLAVSADGGATWTESAAGGPFDLRSAAQTDQGAFVGDYQGLAGLQGSFLPFFAMAIDDDTRNRSDVFARPAAPGAAFVASGGSGFSAPRRLRTGPRRSF